MLRKDIDIGPIILKVFSERKREKGLTVGKFADKLGCHKNTIYSIFNSRSVDTYMLIRISEILDYNFLLEYFKENKPPVFYLVLVEANSAKIEAMQADQSLKIIHAWNNV